MEHFKYLILGGGMAADAAVQGIRSVDPSGKIGVIGTETDPPYNRPPLTKGLWKGESLEKIWRNTESQNVTLRCGQTASAIDCSNKRVVLAGHNDGYSWDKLLLATGGSPRKFSFENDQIIYFRTLQDYQRLRALTGKGERFAVIGGGFIGSEIAAALTMNQKKVVMIFPGESIGHTVYPAELSQFVTEYYRQKGVEIRGGEKVNAIENRGKQLAVKTSSQEFIVDGVVAGLGIVPNTKLAAKAGLKVEDGIVVDEFLRTSNPDIYAAGDVAAFFNPALGKRIRVEHEDNANTTGKVAGMNMAGKTEPYHHLPFFYSDLFDLGYEAVGELNSRLETFADWKQPNKEGVVYYLENGRVRGVLLWNVWNQVDAARALIAERGPFTAQNLQGRIK